MGVEAKIDGNKINDARPLAVEQQGDTSVRSHGITISQTPTVTAGAYAAGDAVGGAWSVRAQTNDALASVTFGFNGWREEIA